MRSVVGLEHIEVKCILGVEPHERMSPRILFVDVKVEIDITNASRSDDLVDTIDYVKIAHLCNEIAKAGSYHLIEALATAIIEAIMKKFSPFSAWVCVRKPSPMPGVGMSFVEVSRT